MKYTKKIISLLSAAVVVLAVNTIAFADTTPHESEDTGEDYSDSSYEDVNSDGGYSDESADSGYTEESSEDSYSEESSDNGYTEESSEDSYSEESSAAENSGESSSQSSSEGAAAGVQNSSSEASGNNSGESSAAETGGTVSSGEGSEEYVVIGKIEQKKNEFSDIITIGGIGLIALGVLGIACVIAWSVAGSRAAKTPDEEVYEAVGQADARNRSAAPREQRGWDRPEAPVVPARVVAKTPTEEIPKQAVRQQAVRQQAVRQPIRTQQARQDEEAIMPQDTRAPQARPQKQQVNAAPPQQSPGAARTAPAKRREYDTDEILREALRDKDN